MLDTGEPGEVAGPTGFIYHMGLILAVSLTAWRLSINSCLTWV